MDKFILEMNHIKYQEEKGMDKTERNYDKSLDIAFFPEEYKWMVNSNMKNAYFIYYQRNASKNNMISHKERKFFLKDWKYAVLADAGRDEPLFSCCQLYLQGSTYLEINLVISWKIQDRTPIQPVITLLDIQPTNTKILIRKELYTSMFIAELSKIVNGVSQSKCLISD